jgi:hypothetical protein
VIVDGAAGRVRRPSLRGLWLASELGEHLQPVIGGGERLVHTTQLGDQRVALLQQPRAMAGAPWGVPGRRSRPLSAIMMA